MTPDPLDKLKAIDSALEATDVLSDPSFCQQVIDALPDALLVVDTTGIVIMVNRELEIMFGYPRLKLIGERFDTLLPEELRERHKTHFAGYFEYPTVRPMNAARTFSGRRSDGKNVNVQIILGPLVTARGIFAIAVIRKANHGG